MYRIVSVQVTRRSVCLLLLSPTHRTPPWAGWVQHCVLGVCTSRDWIVSPYCPAGREIDLVLGVSEREYARELGPFCFVTFCMHSI